MPNCTNCGATTIKARLKGTDQCVLLDKTDRRWRGPGRYRVVEWPAPGGIPIVQRVTAGYVNPEMIEHNVICGRPLNG